MKMSNILKKYSAQTSEVKFYDYHHSKISEDRKLYLEYQAFCRYKMDLLKISEDYFKEQDRLRAPYLHDVKQVQLMYENNDL
jgi:hypothetical protein